MGRAQTRWQKRQRYAVKYSVLTAVICLLASLGAAQATGGGAPEAPLAKELTKYPGLLPEFGQLLQKIQRDVQFPPARSQSRLLPLLPQATIFYVAFPNFGDASHQVLTIFQNELQQSSVLRTWWHDELDGDGLKVEDSLEKFYQLSQYLGDEIVISGTAEGRKGPELLILAQVRKPGLKDFLQQLSKNLSEKSTPAWRVLNAQDLATLKDTGLAPQPMILVRPDFVLGALDVATLRSFNAWIERNARGFVSTEFGQRLAQAYEGGTLAVAAANLQKILSEIPQSTDHNEMVFQRAGFSDVKYVVWEHRNVAGEAASQMELSFTGPRRGMASWLAAPGPVGSLDFVSPRPVLVGTVRLKNPAKIFDELKDLSVSWDANAFAGIAQIEDAWKLSLKDDLLSRLGGEITFELDSLMQPDPKWRAILQVSDSDRLQATLSRLLAQMPLNPEQSEEDGVIYHALRVASASKTLEIAYAFVDGYLVIASDHESVVEAVRLHRSGESLAKSKKFLAALPPGHGSDVSALFYQDPVAMAALTIGQASPRMAESLSKATAEISPAVVCAYGEDRAIREASRSGGVDVGAILIGAAIAIPNLLRARIAANEASAVSMIRTVNTAQIVYSTSYPERGFARDLATLGPDPRSASATSAGHAGLIDATLGNASCTEGTWCTKSGFRFSISAICKKSRCEEFVVVGTPVSTSAGTRSFCSTADAVVRYKTGLPLISSVSVSECRSWSPLQ